MLNDGLFVALNPQTASDERPVHEDWAISYDYVMPSTLFHFAEYFAWIRLLQEHLNFELFESDETKDRFFANIWRVTKSLASWPKDDVVGVGADAQVFALQQRAIGELVIRRDGETLRSMTFPEFLKELESDERFARVFEPLRCLVEGVEPDTKRWSRLQGTLTALRELDAECRRLLTLA